MDLPWKGCVWRMVNRAPRAEPTTQPGGFKDYFDGYIDQVWQYQVDDEATLPIAGNGIKFDTQDGAQLVSCHVQDEAMTCDRTTKPFGGA